MKNSTKNLLLAVLAVSALGTVHNAISRFYLQHELRIQPFQETSQVVFPNAQPGTLGEKISMALAFPIYPLISERYIPFVAQGLNSLAFAVLLYSLLVFFFRKRQPREAGLFAAPIWRRVLQLAIVAAVGIVLCQNLWPHVSL